MKAPFLTKAQLRVHAAQFLNRFHNSRTLPIPIEAIVEFTMGIDIVPMPGLQSSFDVVAFISADKTTIRVDDYVYTHRETRYRFSLAHEVGHWFLHVDQWRDFTFDSVQTWKEQTQQFPDKEYGILEWQANEFAGLILVPPEELKDEVERLKLTLNASGYSHEALTPKHWRLQWQFRLPGRSWFPLRSLSGESARTNCSKPLFGRRITGARRG